MRTICFGKYIRLLIFALLILGLHLRAFSQSDAVNHPEKDLKTHPDSTSSLHSLYAGVGSGSNMIFLGSSISHDHLFYTTALTYGYKNCFYASVSASHITEVNPFVAFYALSLNYNHVFNTWFDISSSVSAYKTPSSLRDILFSDFAFINLTTGFDWKLVYTKVSFGDLISDENRGYIQIRNSRYFETPEFFKGKGQISFDPNINTLFGELVKITSITGVTKYGSSPPFRHLKKNPNNTSESISYKFGLMDFEFSLPVTFSYGNISIEAEPSYILPAYKNTDYPAPEGFTFYLNINFKIF